MQGCEFHMEGIFEYACCIICSFRKCVSFDAILQFWDMHPMGNISLTGKDNSLFL